MLKQRHQFFAAMVAAADACAITAASYAAWAGRVQLRGESWPSSWENYLKEPLLLYTIPVTVAMIWLIGLYKPRRDKSLASEIAQLAKAAFVSVIGVLVLLWAVGADIIDNPAARAVEHWNRDPEAWGAGINAARIQLGLLLPALLISLTIPRTSFRIALRWMRSRGWNLRHAAIIGTGRLGQIVDHTLERNSWTGIEVTHFISHHDRTRRTACQDRPVRGGLEDLEAILEKHPVDAIYLALPSSSAARIPEILKRLERFVVDVRIVPDVHPRFLPQSMAVSELEGMPILSYRECPMLGLGGVSKRALDILGALAGLAIFGPLMLLIAIAVRLSGPGRVIFKQRRVGLAGEVFKIYKFRTMVPLSKDDDTEPSWTTRDDPRITRLGAFLRRTSLDELPQLINVLQGRMSLVGPRPERPELIDRFREDWRGYMLRQHVKAGITGWAQVNGLRGDTSLKKRLQYDLFYVRHWSLWFDVRILFMTVFRGFVHRNAH